MAEDAQNVSKHHAIAYADSATLELSPSTNHLEPGTEECERPFTSPPPAGETMSDMRQRRQKCELRRLLKHTCPELKKNGALVEEELADILNNGPNTGYQCEVQSKRWLFENNAVSPVDFHQIKRDFQDCDIKNTSRLSEEPMCSSPNKENRPQSPTNEPEEVTSEQNIRVDVKATRRMFEVQSVDTLKDSQRKSLPKGSPSPKRNVISEEHSRSDQKPKNDSATCNFGAKTYNANIHFNLPSDVNFKDTNETVIGISKAKQVFENRSHDEENISTTSDNCSKDEEMLKANVRNRAQMFESTPLDKINQQTKEESETILENMQDTLISLWKFNIIQADGSILEANENGHVKRARYFFIKDSTPEVHDEEIVTGSIKNIMLQMLPGTNLNSTVTFLKEDSQGNMEIHKVDVPTHQLPFTELQDKDCRIANVVQITEDLLGQEKSLRKGVLIQNGATDTREITVYALIVHNEDSISGVEFDKMEHRSIPSSQTNILDPEKEDPKTDVGCSSGLIWDSSSVLDLEANRTMNVQLVQRCPEKEDFDHLKHLQKTSSHEDISASTEEAEKISEMTPGLSLQSAKSKESKLSSKESVVKNENHKTEEPMQAKVERCHEMDDKIQRISPDQDIKDDGAVPQAELVDVVVDEAKMEANALQQSVQVKHQPASQPNQTQQISDSGSPSHELMKIKKDGNISENNEPSQISKPEQEENEDVMRGGIQAALDSLGKSNFNVTKGDFRAAMIYRNSGCAGHSKVTVVDQPSDTTGAEDKTELSASGPEGEEQVLQAPSEGVDTGPCQRPSENKPLRNQTHVSTDAPTKKHKTPTGPKPAIPPKPDHLKMKPNPNASVAKSLQGDGQATCSKPANEENREPSCPNLCPDPMSYKDALCNLQPSGDAHDSKPDDTSISVKENDGSIQAKLNPTQVVEESPSRSPESIQNVSESSTGFQTTLQNFGVKAAGAVAPVKPKRIKMAKDHVKNFSDNTNNNSAVQKTEITARHDGSSLQVDGTLCGTHKAEENDKCDDQQKSQVVRRKKKMRRETEDEKRQRLSVHMDEIMKGNVTAVMEIFDKLKKQEELKNILSKVEEIQEDSSEVDVRSYRNIFEGVPDWVVPQEKKNNNPKMVIPEHRGGASETPVEPDMMSSMQVAFGDLEKAGAEIIRLKEQTLARLMDIEEAIKKALYSVSTLKSDSDIVGLSGLFRESMVAEECSPTSGNIRKISIGSSKSQKAQNQNGQSTIPAQNSKPELFIPTNKQRSTSPASPSFISIQSAARKREDSPSQNSLRKAEPKEEDKHQCCCNRRQCALTEEASSSPANQRRQISVLEVRTAPERERTIGTRTISENYERRDCFGNQFYSSKTSTLVTTNPETRTTSKKLITSSPTSIIVTYPRVNTCLISQDQHPL